MTALQKRAAQHRSQLQDAENIELNLGGPGVSRLVLEQLAERQQLRVQMCSPKKLGGRTERAADESVACPLLVARTFIGAHAPQ
jgi:hypothetical protein